MLSEKRIIDAADNYLVSGDGSVPHLVAVWLEAAKDFTC
jgi:hypothetical protein